MATMQTRPGLWVGMENNKTKGRSEYECTSTSAVKVRVGALYAYLERECVMEIGPAARPKQLNEALSG